MLNFIKSRNAGKKLLITFLTLSMLNYVAGCYSNEQVATSEVWSEDYKTINEVIFTDGKVVRFEPNTGSFAIAETAISGVSVDSIQILLSTVQVKEIRRSIVRSIPLNEMNGKKITEVVNKSDRIYEFDDEGGFITDDGKNVKGKLYSGYAVNFRIDLIKEFHTERPTLIDKDSLKIINPSEIKQLVTNANELITFNKEGVNILHNVGIISGVVNNQSVNFNEDDILYVNISKIQSLQTGLLIAGIVIGVIVIAIALIPEPEPTPAPVYTGGGNIEMSCPFIYSFDGNLYQFDAQPLGGAITKGLERSDYSRLDFLDENVDTYKILISNEMPETQYVDEIKLFAVEHPESSEVFTDLSGKMYVIQNPRQCMSARDENMMDISPFINQPDNVMWQTKLPVTSEKSKSDHRNHLTFAFPKPADAKTAHLLVNAGSSIWGSYMIKEMLNLFGNQVDSWYKKIDNLDKSEIRNEETMKMIVDEELYYMNINVKEQNGWVKRGLVFSGGPFVNETHVYNLDISNATGDSLFIQLNPALGFWNIDYLAVEYEDYPAPVIKELMLNNVVTNEEENITVKLLDADNDYYVMENDGDFAIAQFEKSSISSQTNQTIFLKTTGYYNIHLAKQQPMQAELIYEFINKPGAVVDYSLNLYESKLATIK